MIPVEIIERGILRQDSKAEMQKQTIRWSIIIPVYQEKATFSRLMESVLHVPLAGVDKEIIVVESNSTDGSRALVQEYEAKGLIRAIYEAKPQGKGHAVKAGLAVATGDWVLIQDADLEYDVADYAPLWRAAQESGSTFVMGSRHMGRQDWRYRRSGAGKWFGPVFDGGVWVLTLFFNVLNGVSLTDPCTMFKLFRRDCLQGLTLRSDGFEMDLELVAKLIRKGVHPLEIPVTYNARSFREGKKVRLWRDGWRSLWAILRSRFSSLS
jgi:glycosyltransferase involved in cell wall biosynthesis